MSNREYRLDCKRNALQEGIGHIQQSEREAYIRGLGLSYECTSLVLANPNRLPHLRHMTRLLVKRIPVLSEKDALTACISNYEEVRSYLETKETEETGDTSYSGLTIRPIKSFVPFSKSPEELERQVACQALCLETADTSFAGLEIEYDPFEVPLSRLSKHDREQVEGRLLAQHDNPLVDLDVEDNPYLESMAMGVLRNRK